MGREDTAVHKCTIVSLEQRERSHQLDPLLCGHEPYLYIIGALRGAKGSPMEAGLYQSENYPHSRFDSEIDTLVAFEQSVSEPLWGANCIFLKDSQ